MYWYFLLHHGLNDAGACYWWWWYWMHFIDQFILCSNGREAENGHMHISPEWVYLTSQMRNTTGNRTKRQKCVNTCTRMECFMAAWLNQWIRNVVILRCLRLHGPCACSQDYHCHYCSSVLLPTLFITNLSSLFFMLFCLPFEYLLICTIFCCPSVLLVTMQQVLVSYIVLLLLTFCCLQLSEPAKRFK